MIKNKEGRIGGQGETYFNMKCKGLNWHFVTHWQAQLPLCFSLCGTRCPHATPSSSSFFPPLVSLFFLSSLHDYFRELRESSLLAAALHNKKKKKFPSSP